ncbi:hypothetical protein XPA_004216 [Xanthoria parietina]
MTHASTLDEGVGSQQSSPFPQILVGTHRAEPRSENAKPHISTRLVSIACQPPRLVQTDRSHRKQSTNSDISPWISPTWPRAVDLAGIWGYLVPCSSSDATQANRRRHIDPGERGNKDQSTWFARVQDLAWGELARLQLDSCPRS